MATKRFKEIKNLSKDELATKLRETAASLFQAKIKLATGQLADTSSMWRMRKDIARMKTLASQHPAGKGSK